MMDNRAIENEAYDVTNRSIDNAFYRQPLKCSHGFLYAEKLDPHPQLLVELGLMKLKP
jgi:hypothetical protein